jgi:hypothetical protein
MRNALSNLPSLGNKVRSSALFITGTTSCCFIAEDFLYLADAERFRPRWIDQLHKEQMSKLEMDRPDYMERDACGDPGIDRQSREYAPRASEIAVVPWVSAVWPATARARGNPTKIE